MKMNKSCLLAAVAALSMADVVAARPPVKTGPDRNRTSLQVGLKRIGTLKTKTAAEIKDSNWTIDGAPLDRDFADFDEYREYLPLLGATKIRILSGWAKCEKERGKIDVGWLDHVVDWCKAHSIEPVLELSYGNPIYPGAGGAGLFAGIPNTPEGLKEWDRWVDFLASHFADRVTEWAMWNEPDNRLKVNTPEMIAAFNVRSAKIIRKHIPKCRIHGLSLGHNKPEVLESCLKPMGEDTKLFDTFIYHGYVKNPDYSYPLVEEQKKLLEKYAPHAKLRQGENGCPSEYMDKFALRNHPWTEISQAKWVMRRALGDLGHDVESGLFCIVDINYRPPTFPSYFSNRKGYLRTNASNEVIAVKRVFYAMQNVISVFNANLTRVTDPRIGTTDRALSLFEYRTRSGAGLFTFWTRGKVTPGNAYKLKTEEAIRKAVVIDKDDAPNDSLETRTVVFEWKGAPLEKPVWCDLMTGWVYEIPPENQIVHSCGVTLVDVPCYDSPCLVAEAKALDIE